MNDAVASGTAGTGAMSWSRILRAVAVFYVFVAPIGVALVVWALSERLEREQRQNEQRVGAEQIVTNLCRNAGAHQCCADWARGVMRRLKWTGDLCGATAEPIREAVRVFAFDAGGRRLSIPGTTPGLVFASEQSYACLRRLRADRGAELSKRELTLLESFLGTISNLDAMVRRPGTLSALGSSGPTGVLAGLFPFRSSRWGAGDLLFLVDLKRIAPETVVDDAVARARRHVGDRFDIGFIDLWQHCPVEARGEPTAVASLACELMRARAEKSWVREGRWLAWGAVTRRFIVYVWCKTRVADVATPATVPWKTLLVVGWLVLLVWWYRVRHGLFVPLRVQVVGLFAVAAAVNGLVMLSFAQTYRQAWDAALLRENVERSRDVLEQFDRRFAGAVDRQLQQYRQLLQGAGEDAARPDVIVARLRRFEAHRGSLSIALVGAAGELQYVMLPPGRSAIHDILGRGVRKLLSLIGMYALRRNHREHVAQRGAQENLRDNVTDPAGALACDMALHMMRSEKNIFVMRNEGQVTMMYPDIWRNARGEGLGFLFIAHEPRFLEEIFLRRETRRINAQLARARWRCAAVTEAQMPAWLTRDEILRRFHDGVLQAQSIDWVVHPLKRGPHLITGFPARHLEGITLYAFVPMAPIQARSAAFTSRVLWVAASLFGFSLVLASLFSSVLLEPLRRISAGVQRLAQGNYLEPVMVGSGDELEEIGRGINETAAELRELVVAGELQEQLCPHATLRVGSWLCRGEVHGDRVLTGYYDYLALADHRFAFWLVQRTGARLAGALGLANARMALRLLFAEQNHDAMWVLDEYRRRFPGVVAGATSGLELIVGVGQRDGEIIDIVLHGSFVIEERDIQPGSPPFSTEVIGRGDEPCGRRLVVAPGRMFRFTTADASGVAPAGHPVLEIANAGEVAS